MEKTLIDEKAQHIKEEANKLYNDLRLSLLRQGKTIYLTALGGSMYPFVKSGDKIKIEPINGRKIRIGDIAAVDMKTDERPRFFVHRVVKITGDGKNRVYFTKGDAHNGKGLDGPIAIDSIVGKVTQIKRKGLNIDLEIPLWRYLNNSIGRLSLRYPKIIPSFSTCINLILERRSFLVKVKNRLKKGNPILYNTEELILICARKDLNDELIKKAEGLMREGLDWGHFTDIAMRGGVTVLVYKALRRLSDFAYIPLYATERLKSTALFIMSRTASQYRDMMEILKLFSENNIPVVPLKGLLLAQRFYGDDSARGLSVDFDFLIREEDRKRAIALLKDVGHAFNPDNEIKEWQWQYTFHKPGTTMIDLHWDITMGCRSQKRIDGFWDGTRRVETDGVGYYEFKEEELLLYLCVHLTNSDAIRHLRYICDINEFLNKYSNLIDWDSVVEKARNWRLSASLYAGLILSQKLLGAARQDAVLRKIKPSLIKRLFMDLFMNKKFILRNSAKRKLMDNFLSYIFFELIEAKRTTEYWPVIKRVLFPPKEVLLSNKSYSSKPVYAGYALRLFRGLFNLYVCGRQNRSATRRDELYSAALSINFSKPRPLGRGN